MVTRTPLPVERLPVRFVGDDRWVITRPFLPGGEERTRNLFQRVSRLSDEEVKGIYRRVVEDFRHRHADIEAVFSRNFEAALISMGDAGEDSRLSSDRRLLIGSY